MSILQPSIFNITSKKVSKNNVEFLTREITSKKGRGNNLNISISKITSKIVRGNDLDFLSSENTSKKYVETTGNSSKFGP